MQYGTHQLTTHSLRTRVPGGPQGDEHKDKNSLTLHTTTDVYALVNVDRRTSIGIYLLVLLLPPDTADVHRHQPKPCEQPAGMQQTIVMHRQYSSQSTLEGSTFVAASQGMSSPIHGRSCWLDRKGSEHLCPSAYIVSNAQ